LKVKDYFTDEVIYGLWRLFLNNLINFVIRRSRRTSALATQAINE
jgi:hypothetical protein